MSTEQTIDTAPLRVIVARQHEMRAGELKKENDLLERAHKRQIAFERTGILEMYETVKNISVVHPSPNIQYVRVPLLRWLNPVYCLGNVVGLKARPTPWNSAAITKWATRIDTSGKVIYYAEYWTRSNKTFTDAKEMRSTFIDWLADIIDPKELEGIEPATLETPKARRRVTKLSK